MHIILSNLRPHRRLLKPSLVHHMLLRRPKILFLAASLLEGFKVCISFFFGIYCKMFARTKVPAEDQQKAPRQSKFMSQHRTRMS
jgi:hypothetical protein